MNASPQLIAKTSTLKSGRQLKGIERIEVIQAIADKCLGTNVRPKDIMNMFGTSRNTAIDWLAQAHVLLDKESKISREGLRNIHRGQIEYMTNKLIGELEKATDSQERLAIHDRIIKYMDARARTNGLNSEQVNHEHTLKPLVITRATTVIEQA